MSDVWVLRGVRLHDTGSQVTGWRNATLVGYAFPAVVAEPGGAWFVRFAGRSATKHPGRHTALALLVGGCPDCECGPDGCAYCIQGCADGGPA